MKNKTDIREMILESLPGTINQLESRLKIPKSTIRNYLQVLKDNGKISFMKIIRNEKVQNYYFKNIEENFKSVDLPNDLFNPIADKIHIYALTGNTFSLAVEKIKHWEDKSIWKGSINYHVEDSMISIELPSEMKEHYKVPFGALSPSFSPDKKTAFFSIRNCE